MIRSLAVLVLALVAGTVAAAALTVWALLSILLSLAEIGVSQPWPST